MMIQGALENPSRPRRFFKGMRMLVGGAAPPAAMIAAFDRFDMHILQVWGMTEMSPTGTISQLRPAHDLLPLAQQHAIRAMQGVAAPLVDIKIVGNDGQELPWDGAAVGEIQVRGPWIAGGYHNTPRDPGKISVDGSGQSPS